MPLIASWVPGANETSCGFPLNNLPCGVFGEPGARGRLCTAIGDSLLDLTGLAEAGLAPRLGTGPDPLRADVWNEVMAAGPAAWAALRERLTALLAEGAEEQAAVARHLRPLAGAELRLPFRVAEFTDFYSGRHHALMASRLLRGPEATLPPAWDHMPIGYNGRASSVVVSGTPVPRPWGQIRPDPGAGPLFAPSRRFDFELELGAIVGQPTAGPVTVARAEAMIFGYVLLNDWSARDIQAWEYQPLGPFQSKATATTISPWIVTAAALAPFRVAGPVPPVPLLPYLRPHAPLHPDIGLEVALAPAGGAETVIARTSAAELSYAAAQQLAHHTTSGCPMRVGDLLGSGTISGPAATARGSLLELSQGGTAPLALPGGQARTFLEDGDTVCLRGAAEGAGVRIGFGECHGRVLPAAPLPGDWPA